MRDSGEVLKKAFEEWWEEYSSIRPLEEFRPYVEAAFYAGWGRADRDTIELLEGVEARHERG